MILPRITNETLRVCECMNLASSPRDVSAVLVHNRAVDGYQSSFGLGTLAGEHLDRPRPNFGDVWLVSGLGAGNVGRKRQSGLGNWGYGCWPSPSLMVSDLLGMQVEFETRYALVWGVGRPTLLISRVAVPTSAEARATLDAPNVHEDDTEPLRGSHPCGMVACATDTPPQNGAGRKGPSLATM